MKDFDQVLTSYKANRDIALIHSFIRARGELLLFEAVFNKIEANLLLEAGKGLIDNFLLLDLIRQLAVEDEHESYVAQQLVKSYNLFMHRVEMERETFHLNSKAVLNVQLYMDILFHCPTFFDYVDASDKSALLRNIVSLAYLAYDYGDDLSFAVAFSVSVLFDFPLEDIEPYKDLYLNHFDAGIVEDFILMYE
ncbi:MAG TPA: hypothetical protein VK183_10000 [Flavobacterium sp.]|nr:hypothetical protein [Flavobacterium sp.]